MDAHSATAKAVSQLASAATTDSPVLRESLTAQAQAHATLALVAEVRELRQTIDKAARR